MDAETLPAVFSSFRISNEAMHCKNTGCYWRSDLAIPQGLALLVKKAGEHWRKCPRRDLAEAASQALASNHTRGGKVKSITVGEVNEVWLQIRKLESTDEEAAHTMEDNLYRKVLEGIMNAPMRHSKVDLKELAAEALRDPDAEQRFE